MILAAASSVGNAIINSYIEYAEKNKHIEEQINLRPLNNVFENTIVDYKDSVTFDLEIWKTGLLKDAVDVHLYINNELITEKQTVTNEVINIDLTNHLPVPATDAIKVVSVDIVAEDINGHTDTYSFEMYVANIDNYINVFQTFSGDPDNVNSNKPYQLNYTLDYLSIDVSYLKGYKLPKVIQVKDILYEAIFPNGLYLNPETNREFNIESLTDGATKVTRSFGTIEYRLTDDYVYVPIIETESFSLTVIPNKGGNLLIDDVRMITKGIGNDYDEQNFAPIELLVERFRFETPQVPYLLFKQDQIKFPEYVIAGNPEGFTVRFSSSDESVATVNDQGVITAVHSGIAVITAELFDENDISTGETLTITIRVSEELSVESGFTNAFDITIEDQIYMRLFNRTYDLEDFVIIRPESHVYGVSMTFYLDGVELNGSTYQFSLEKQFYDIEVKIRQLNHNGEVIKEVVDTAKIVVFEENPDDRH